MDNEDAQCIGLAFATGTVPNQKVEGNFNPNLFFNLSKLRFIYKCFVHPIFHFWFLVTFGSEVTKIQKYYVIFVYSLQGKMGKTEKNQKENRATKATKIPKIKRRKYGMNET